MRDFQAKRKTKKLLFSWITLVILVGINFFLARSVYDMYQKERYTNTKMSQAERVYDGLRQRKAELEVKVARLGSPEGVDLVLRRKFQVAKLGEELVVIVPTVATTNAEPPVVEKRNLWQTIIGFFEF